MPDKLNHLNMRLGVKVTLYILLCALTFVLTTGIIITRSLHYVSDVDDAALISTKSEFVLATLAQDDSEENLRQIVTLQRFPVSLRKRVYVAIFDDKRQLRAVNTAMGSLDGFVANTLSADMAGVSGRGTQQTTIESDRSFTWRIDRIRGQSAEWYVLCAVDHDVEQNILAVLRNAFFIIILLVVLGSFGLAWLVNTAVMKPVQKLSRHAAQIGTSPLTMERVDQERYPPEFSSLVIAFNHMLTRLDENFSSLASFSSNIAHELRTPVGNMLGEVQVILERDRTPEEYRQTLQSVVEEVERLRSIINSLLLLARHESGLQGKGETLRLAHELTLICDFYSGMAHEKNVEIKLETDSAAAIVADRTLFQQAIGNLISNAIKHTPTGSTIQLSAKIQNNFVEVAISDKGPGIPTEALPFIFDRFFRVDTARDQASGGVGLGLTIVKSIIELYGGTIAVESELGAGSTFKINWPALDTPSS